MLKIDDLRVSLEEEEKQIIKGLSLSINPGEVHAIMGPNGSGKSTLSSVLAGKDGYIVDSGTVNFDGSDLLESEVEERAALGVFMAFQYPIEIPGVGNMNFLRTALNSQRKTRGQEELNAADFLYWGPKIPLLNYALDPHRIPFPLKHLVHLFFLMNKLSLTKR